MGNGAMSRFGYLYNSDSQKRKNATQEPLNLYEIVFKHCYSKSICQPEHNTKITKKKKKLEKENTHKKKVSK